MRYLAALDAHRHVEGLRITGSRAERERHAAGEGLTCEQVAEAGASICAVIDADDEVRRASDWHALHEHNPGTGLVAGSGPSETEALVAALEAAPRRLPC